MLLRCALPVSPCPGRSVKNRIRNFRVHEHGDRHRRVHEQRPTGEVGLPDRPTDRPGYMRLAGTTPNSHAERRLVRRFSSVRISRSPQISLFALAGRSACTATRSRECRPRAGTGTTTKSTSRASSSARRATTASARRTSLKTRIPTRCRAPRGARGVFSGLSRDGTENGAPGQRGITPDLRVRAAVGVEMHYDAKVVHVGTSAYSDTNGATAARRSAAANTRARRIVSEYERHARKIDMHCAGMAPNDVGPVLRRLREVGITGIAFGAFGKASDDAHRLLKAIAVRRRRRGALGRCHGQQRVRLQLDAHRQDEAPLGLLSRARERAPQDRAPRGHDRREKPHARGTRTEPRPAHARRRKLLPLPPARRPAAARARGAAARSRPFFGRGLFHAPPTPRLRNSVSNPTSAKYRG